MSNPRQLEDDKMNLAHQQQFVNTLMENISQIMKISKSVPSNRTDILDPVNQKFGQTTLLMQTLNSYQVRLNGTPPPLTTKKTECLPLRDHELDNLILLANDISGFLSETFGRNGLHDPSLERIAVGNTAISSITPGYEAPKVETNLVTIFSNNLQEFKTRDTHAIRTAALRSLKEAILGNQGEKTKADLMRLIVTTDNKNANSAKIFFKTFFKTSRHHPEIRIIKLLSEFKDDNNNDPKIAKHNSEILKKIDSISKSYEQDPKSKSSATAKSFMNMINKFTSETIDSNERRVTTGMISKSREDLVKNIDGLFNTTEAPTPPTPTPRQKTY